ncbi:unnamed protein product [Oikopleura dioica]|uniref:Uncharacterized protein n=1 Tax=Oikopleura dioica TaxID=34765 RepID=E4Z205_OIKDI|nr:unnamed protein product [Oikopleura dioica]
MKILASVLLATVSSQIGEVRNDLKCGKSAGFAICSSANRSESCCNHSIGKCLNSKEKSTCDCPTCVDFSALSRGLMQIRAKLAQDYEPTIKGLLLQNADLSLEWAMTNMPHSPNIRTILDRVKFRTSEMIKSIETNDCTTVDITEPVSTELLTKVAKIQVNEQFGAIFGPVIDEYFAKCTSAKKDRLLKRMNRINAIVTQSCKELNLECPGFQKTSFLSSDKQMGLAHRAGLARARQSFDEKTLTSSSSNPRPQGYHQFYPGPQNHPQNRPSYPHQQYNRPQSSNSWSPNQSGVSNPSSAWIKIPKFDKFASRYLQENPGPFVNLYKYRKNGSYSIRRHFEG